MSEYDNHLIAGNLSGVAIIATGAFVLQQYARFLVPYGITLCMFTVLVYCLLED